MRLTEFFPSRMMRSGLLLAGILAWTLLLTSCGAEAPTFEVGSIEVTSSPSGASVILNGDDTQFTTPHILENLDLATYEVWVDHPDFITRNNPVAVDLHLKQNVGVDFALSDTGFRIASPAGARILIDGEDTGRIVPAGVAPGAPGPVAVSLELDGYLVLPGEFEVTVVNENIVAIPDDTFAARSKKTVVLEGFANVSCIPCPQLTDNLLAMAAKPGFGGDRVQFIEFSVSWPELGDPFYWANPEENSARSGLYNVLGAPDLYLDGARRTDALDAAAMEASILAALETEPGFLIDVTADFSATSVPITVTLNPYQDMDFSEYALVVAIYRKEISMIPAPGVNGQTVFHHVFLDQVDTPPALPGNLPAGIQEQFQLTASIQTPGPDTYVALAFVQHEGDLTILQAGSSEMTVSSPAASTERNSR